MMITLEYITPNAAEFIGRMAGICYNASPEGDRCIKRAQKCAQDGHLATLRFAHAVFNVKEISRICSHQFVRSKHLDFLQRSQRYCKEQDTNAFYFPQGVSPEQYNKMRNHHNNCEKLYNELLNEGVKKEDARFVLPESKHTELNVVGNLQAWKDFITLRATKHAQQEIRHVAISINNLLAKECPALFLSMEYF